MKGIRVTNADSEEKKTQTTLTVPIAFTHGAATTVEEAQAIIYQAMVAFAKAKMLDVYLRDEKEAAIGIDEKLLLPEIQKHFQRYFFESVLGHRTEGLHAQARQMAGRELLGEDTSDS